MDSVLYHHGVKGMKWGVRHKRSSNLRKNAKEAVNRGRTHVERFLKDNGKLLVTSAVFLGSSALGVGYVGTLTNAALNLSFDSLHDKD